MAVAYVYRILITIIIIHNGMAKEWGKWDSNWVLLRDELVEEEREWMWRKWRGKGFRTDIHCELYKNNLYLDLLYSITRTTRADYTIISYGEWEMGELGGTRV